MRRYDLTVHDYAAGCKAVHDIDAFSRVFVLQELYAQLGIGRVNGYVHRAYVQVDYALYLALGEVCERDVVSQQEAQAGVVVLEVHGLAHALGELVDKAEQTVVRAASGIIHEILGKLKTEIAPLRLFNAHRVLRAVGPAQRYVQHGLIGEIFIVEHVVDDVPVYLHYLVARVRLVQQRTVVIYF